MSKPIDADVERLKSVLSGLTKGVLPADSEETKRAVMIRAQQLALEGVPLARGIRQAKDELGLP